MEGLPGHGRGSLQAHDARRRRVHPPLSDPCITRPVPSHPSLRFVRQCQSGQQHCIGPPAARRTRPDPVERRERRRRKSSRRPRVERLPLLRRAYDHHRDLRTRLPAAAVTHPIDRARQLMTSTLFSPSRIAAPVPGRYPHCRRRPSANASLSVPPSTAKTHIPYYEATVQILEHRDLNQLRGHYSTVVPAPNRNISAYIDANPHRPTPLPAQTTRDFLP